MNKTQITDEESRALRVKSVGPKGRLAIVPDGWQLVPRGPVLTGDRFANTVTGKFQDVEEDDLVCDASWFDALSRKQK